MDTSQTGAATAALAASGATKSQQSRATLADNFNTFLTLLTTQLQNQDPLNPMDSNEFTRQLVSYSQVEQAIQTNQNLETLISSTKAQDFSNLVGYLGKTATMDSNVAGLKNGQASWDYNLPANADQVDIYIKDASGNIVHHTTGEKGKGDHTLTWDGKNDLGFDQPEGPYSMSVVAKTAAGNTIDTVTTVKGTVESVETESGVHTLVVNGVNVPLGTLIKVSEPASQNI